MQIILKNPILRPQPKLTWGTILEDAPSLLASAKAKILRWLTENTLWVSNRDNWERKGHTKHTPLSIHVICSILFPAGRRQNQYHSQSKESEPSYVPALSQSSSMCILWDLCIQISHPAMISSYTENKHHRNTPPCTWLEQNVSTQIALEQHELYRLQRAQFLFLSM